jgi:hypothetical protein
MTGTCRRWTPLRGDAGATTLAELIVVAVLLGLVGSLVAAWQIPMQRSAAGFTSRVSDQADLRTAMAHMTKDLRMAIRPANGVPAFLPASTGGDVQFYRTSASGPPVLVRYVVRTSGMPAGTGQLVREEMPSAGTTTPGWRWPTSVPKRQVLVRSLTTVEPLVAYYSLDDAGLPPCAGAVTADCGTPLDAATALAEPDNVGSVEVRLIARSRTDLPGNSELRTRVRLLNAGNTAVTL